MGHKMIRVSRFFVREGDVLHYRRDPAIAAKVVGDHHVELKVQDGRKLRLTFSKAAQECDKLVRGDAARERSVPWERAFVYEDPRHGMETLAERRERIVEEKLATIREDR